MAFYSNKFEHGIGRLVFFLLLLCIMQAHKALTDITEVMGEDITINGQTTKTNEITLHIMEDEVNYLSTISHTNREHNVTDTPSHLYTM